MPGLAAKPIIDVNLVVADSGDEPAYLPDLEAAGFTLRVREPEWEQHRVLGTEDPKTNLHVWSPGSREPARPGCSATGCAATPMTGRRTAR